MVNNLQSVRSDNALRRAQREWMNGFYKFLLLYTAVYAGCLVWDMLALMPDLGITAPALPAEEMNLAYISLLGIYGGSKEFLRWKSAEAFAPEEVAERARWFSMGGAITMGWLCLMLVAMVMKSAELIERLPQDVVRVALEVTGIFTGTNLSKTLLHSRVKNKFAAVPSAGGEEYAEEAGGPRISDQHRQQVLAYLKTNSSINNEACRELTKLNGRQAGRLLNDLEELGFLLGEGTGKGKFYRLPPSGQVQ